MPNKHSQLQQETEHMLSITRLSRLLVSSKSSKWLQSSSSSSNKATIRQRLSFIQNASPTSHLLSTASFKCSKLSTRSFNTVSASYSGNALPTDVREMLRKLMANKRDVGDFSPQSILATVIRVFNDLKQNGNSSGSKAFFLDLFQQLGPHLDSVKTNAEAFVRFMDSERDEGAILASHATLRDSLSGTLEKFFDLILAQSGGMVVLIEMRQELLKVIADVTKAQKEAAKSKSAVSGNTIPNASLDEMTDLKVELGRLKAVEQSLRSKLQHLFSIGFLDLERITWSSPASLLEKIKLYSDSVHPMEDWPAMKKRLGTNRRCFGLFHPSMPLEPLVFIEVALTEEISSKIRPILDGSDASKTLNQPKCAIFYAITSTQAGLSGVDLGHMLIEQVVVALQKEFPSITTFSTFSPIPGFKSWFDSKLSLAQSSSLPLPTNLIQLNEQESKDIATAYAEVFGEKFDSNASHLLAKLLETKEWYKNDRLVKVVEKPLEKICARYLALEKKRNLAFDPVANFHLRNGAQFYRLCFLADNSAKRLKQSHGFMVNYLYQLEHLVENNEKYLTEGRISVSPQIQALLS